MLVEFFKTLLIFESVHALPEACAFVCKQGSIVNQPLKRLPHQLVSWIDIPEDIVSKHKIAPVDPDVRLAEG